MEDILKELHGKSITKNKLFEFLSRIDVEKLGTQDKKVEPTVEPTVEPVTRVKRIKKEIKCGACMKKFKRELLLKQHYENNAVCTKWIELPEKYDIQLPKGLHLIIDDLLKQSFSNGNLECKYCNSIFINNGNLHKHFNVSNVCNKLAYTDFKKRFLTIT